MSITILDILWGLFGYFAGAVPFGLLVAHMAGKGDVRKIGSGNIGATNVLRTGSPALAAITLFLDMFKGFIPVLAARWNATETAALLAGLGAFTGHVFPIWLKFRGGKGVATYIGILFGLSWPLGLACIGIWLATAFISRISSLSALVSAALMPLLAWLMGASPLRIGFLAALGAAIFLTHRANIARLLRGEESRIEFKSKT